MRHSLRRVAKATMRDVMALALAATAVATVTAPVAVAQADSTPPGIKETILIPQPWPLACRTDVGYRRFSTCEPRE
jgi:hypothetical protein